MARELKEEQVVPEDYSMAIIVGRFHIPEPHSAHVDLIDRVVKTHKQVAIFLGIAPLIGTRKNPLDYDSRKRMIQERYPNIIICPLPDMRENPIWVKSFESRIREILPLGRPILYGGRDSFINIYKDNGGSHDYVELEQTVYVSATEVRRNAAREIINDASFRAGIIHAVYNNYPRINMCVDVAPFKEDKEILLARKPNESKYRFIGGHVDMNDKTLEMAASREFREESGGCEIHGLTYVGSFHIDDWRARGLDDVCYKSVLFKGTYMYGNPNPSDDIVELRWFDMQLFSDKKFIEDNIVEEHVPLMTNLSFQYFQNKVEQKTAEETVA